MNIVIVGAGAIGSLFGGLLSKKNTVVLVGRPPHAKAIQKEGLHISGKTRLHMNISAVSSTKDVSLAPDLVLITVKSYDTETAIAQTIPLLGKDTMVLSLQNGLGNVEKIEQVIERNRILAGVTTHGAIFSKPGAIIHTGIGKTILGELTRIPSKRLEDIVHVFNEAGIETSASTDIVKELWSKTIINSSINPITAVFQCNNGYLLKNPLLEKMVEYICTESTTIANQDEIPLNTVEMIERTREVIAQTSKNYSSMLQSIRQGKKTEIDSINGALARYGKYHGIATPLNSILVTLISSMN